MSSARIHELGQRLRRGVAWSLLSAAACGAVFAFFLAPLSLLHAYSYSRSDAFMLVTIPAVVGFGFGFFRWPDTSSRNRQDPPRLSERPSSSDPFYRAGGSGSSEGSTT